MRRVHVSWVDSTSHGTWISPAAVKASPDGLECESYGYLVHETDKVIVIAQSCSYEAGELAQYGHALSIPKVAVTNVKRL